MEKRTIKRLLAVVAALAVVLLATHAVSHWHANGHEDARCQVCHVGHTSIPQAAPRIVAQPATSVERLVLGEELTTHLDAEFTVSIPRAPPA